MKRVGVNTCFNHLQRCISVNSAKPICSVLVLIGYVFLCLCVGGNFNHFGRSTLNIYDDLLPGSCQTPRCGGCGTLHAVGVIPTTTSLA